MPGYDPASIEKKWQNFWLQNKTFAAPNTSTKPKFYALDMFPYPSGKGLHVGHPEGYTATDIVSRFKRAKGFAVMHPMGWDAFGLPAEQTAIKDGVHPRQTTTKNIETFRRQLQALGFSYDWDREVDTTDVNYYRWTQWIFLQLYDTWFDDAQQKGRPIADLIAEFQSGKRTLTPGGNPGPSAANWNDLSPTQQRQILSHYRLAYEAEVPVNWCPGLGTVLANEEVIDGKSEVGGFPVERKPMRQWMLRITAYSERLIDGLNGVQWSESLKEMQRNWIGKSEGAEVHFEISNLKSEISNPKSEMLTVFTTRPDTLFGATYMVIAPEHPLVSAITTADQRDKVDAYRKWAAARSDRERQEDTRKTGEFTGATAINPVNGNAIPIFISDYVLMNYGTGAIMAVPAHDERDHAFATKFKLPIIQVVAPSNAGVPPAPSGNAAVPPAPSGNAGVPPAPSGNTAVPPAPSGNAAVPPALPSNAGVSPAVVSVVDVQQAPFTDEGIAINSPWIEGLPTQQAKSKIITMLEEKNLGKRTINYKIRDWLFSRQRYWGEPFPLVHLQDGTTVPLAESELPLRLPELADYKPTGTIDPPLSKATDWVNVHVLLQSPHADTKSPPPGIASPRPGIESLGSARVVPAHTPGALPARRELNTMPQWAGSCWYFIRYTDAQNPNAFVDPAAEKFWLHNGVDLYVGGVEHAVLHLLYARFWHKVLFDRGLVSCDEPFRRLVNQGLILGEAEYTAFQSADGTFVSTATLDSIEIQEQGMVGLLKNGTRIPGIKIDPGTVEKKGEGFVLKSDPSIRVDARSFKMSKSRGNVVNPDDVIAHYGADSLRLFEMFMGPLEQVKPWSTAGVEGVYRFLQRIWRNIFDVEIDDIHKSNKLLQRHAPDKWQTSTGDLPAEKHARAEADYQAQLPLLHRTIKKVEDDIERLSFNTAIAAMMELNNALGKSTFISLEIAEAFLRILEPFAPHFAEEVLSRIRPDLPATGITSITQLPWPTINPALLVDSTLEIPVQINGKVRSRISIPADADESTVLAAALADPEVQKHTAGKEPKKKIYVKGRLVNLVV